MPNDNELGKLEKVSLRKAWEREDTDFTPWLAREENLVLLAEAIGGGIELELHKTEEKVGNFKADIVCKVNGIDDEWVVIENQLEETDHTHLGQLITYAATLGAVTIVWIASKIRDEHRTAIDWLNKNTNEKMHFFALEIELWKIGDSPIAPKFNIISQPNDWEKETSRHLHEESPLEKFRYGYWVSFIEYLKNNKSAIKYGNPTKWPDMSFGSKKSNILYGMTRSRKKTIAVELYIYQDNLFELLSEEKQAIEKEIGEKLEWRELPEKKVSIIGLQKSADFKNESDWQNQFAWFKEKLEAFNQVFWPYVEKLNSKNYIEGEAENE